ncbi:hypothetical protein FPCIR_13247 [Fusarium pseudocircinatum]|uniref:Uncharacterized protein n=1 Tax=Fusarium pseudocircinatum TaxID=56676 RepID=A0A8H5KLA2_9HYPO|nr:hypothetical protein FPCIR_13247 [Fusarium pseudocircinatum]
MGHSNSTLQSHELSAAGIEKGIPPILRVKYESGWSKFISSSSGMDLFLDGPNDEPMYTLDFENGLDGDIVLHSGPSADSPKLAVSGRESSRSSEYLIRLPSLSGNAPQDELLYCDSELRRRFSFDIQVGHGPDQRVEGFEWRRSGGPEVKSVGQSRRRGLKLVRLGSTNTKEKYSSSEEDLHDGRTKGQGYGYSSDGKEVVAVWANTRSFSSSSGVGELQFRGSGATGELGQLWALMAVMSCMSIWQSDAASSSHAGAAGCAPVSVGGAC